MPDAPRAMQLLDAGHHPQAPAFSHPDHTPDDALLLDRLRCELRAALDAPPAPSGDRRLFVIQPGALRKIRPLAFVGFRGERRPGAPPSVVEAVERADAELVRQLSAGPDLLGYACARLPDGNWINLVLLPDPSATAAWHRHDLHRQVSAQLSPLYYASVRLHGGLLPQGLQGPLQVTSTKYYDFTAGEPWRAQRHFGAAPAH